MTPTQGSDETTLVRAQAEAAAWMALLHSPQRTAATDAGFRRWLAASPLHAHVWEVATDLWNETSGLPRRIPREIVRPHRSRWVPKVAIAAILLCLAILPFAYQYFIHSRVTTVVGEQRTLTLEDGTRVELNTDTRLQLKFDRATRTVVLDAGEAYFQVAHETRPFVVIAGNRKVIAIGTEFTVRHDDPSGDAVTVTLIEGRVAVVPLEAADALPPEPAPNVLMLKAGQRLKLRRHAQPVLDAPPIERVTGWMRGKLIFDHTPLREAAAEFSRYSPTKIVVAAPSAAEIPIGGVFGIGDAKSFAHAVADSYNLRVTSRGDDLILQAATEGSAQPEDAAPNP